MKLGPISVPNTGDALGIALVVIVVLLIVNRVPSLKARVNP